MPPMRILGPVRSSKMGTKASSFFATSRTLAIKRAWLSGLPCDALMRATFMPACTSDSIMEVDSLAGPSVQTILVRRSRPASVVAGVAEARDLGDRSERKSVIES